MIEYLQQYGGYTSNGLTLQEKKELEHLKREKQDQSKNIKSYPYVLVYTAF